jgi:vacuolar protein sorting-associated protein 13A/C
MREEGEGGGKGRGRGDAQGEEAGEEPLRFFSLTPLSLDSPLSPNPRKWYSWDLKVAEDVTNHPTGLAPSGPPCPRIMYGYDAKLRIAVADSSPSSGFPLGLSNEGRVEIPDTVSNRLYSFAVIVAPGPGRFYCTSTAKFYPATILVNMTGFPISYKQEHDAKNSSLGWVLQHGEQIPFHWPNKNISARALQIKLGSDSKEDTLRSDWSLGFNIENVSDFQIRLHNSRKRTKYLGVNVTIRLQNGTNYVTLTGDEIPIYRINNQSTVDFEICQKGISDVGLCQVIHSHNAIPFFWDKPQERDRVLLLTAATSGTPQSPKEIRLDVIARHPTIRVGNKRITCEVVADGPTKVLQLFERDGPEESSTESANSSSQIFPDERLVNLQIKLSMTGIGLCCVHNRKSLLYLTLQSIDLDFEQSNIDQSVEARIHTMQIDNQLYRTPFPVVLFDTSPANTDFIKFSVLRDTRYDKVNFVRYFGFLLQVSICFFVTLYTTS